MIDVSVVIVNWNTRDLLAQCLKSVFETAGDLKLEVFVVDNASSDVSADMVRHEFPQVQIIENQENVGFARANNQAIRQSAGRYVLLLNSDTQARPGALRTLVNALDSLSRAGAGGPRLLNPDGTLQPMCHPMTTIWREFWYLLHLDGIVRLSTYNMTHWDATVAHPVDVVSGACLLLRREALQEIGLLDERYFMYAEEVDFCYRLAERGWEVYWLPMAEVMHMGGGSTRQVSDEMFLQLYKSKYLFFKKTQGWFGGQLFKLILFIAAVLRILASPAAFVFRRDRRDHWLMKTRQYYRLLVTLPSI